MCPLINTPHPEGVIISQPKIPFLGVVFDVDHDFEGPRAPRAHLDTVNRNLSHHLGRPFKDHNAVKIDPRTRYPRIWVRALEPMFWMGD